MSCRRGEREGNELCGGPTPPPIKKAPTIKSLMRGSLLLCLRVAIVRVHNAVRAVPFVLDDARRELQALQVTGHARAHRPIV